MLDFDQDVLESHYYTENCTVQNNTHFFVFNVYLLLIDKKFKMIDKKYQINLVYISFKHNIFNDRQIIQNDRHKILNRQKIPFLFSKIFKFYE